MDFGDFIGLILFLAFIVAPFLKRKKAQTQKPGKSKQGGFSLLGKLNEVLKEAAREMQAQAEQARKKEGADRPGQERQESANQTFWDEIDDRDEGAFYPDDADAQAMAQVEPVNEPSVSGPITQARDSKPEPRKSFGQDAMQTTSLRSAPKQLPAKARKLQQAVIWSEILGKPVAFRD